jgi:hypothetical protein
MGDAGCELPCTVSGERCLTGSYRCPMLS